METPMLDKYTTNLTTLALETPDNYKVIGRDREVAQVIYNLTRRTKNNPILLGDAGVGKTAIVDGLARMIALNNVGERLKNHQIRVLQIAALGQQDVVRKMLSIIEECKRTKGKNILFIDEIHTIMGADNSGGAMDLGDVLKPAMARGEIQLIGATTFDEYDKFIEKDPALERRFQQIIVNEPSREDAIKILKGIKTNFEKFHNLMYTAEALEACVDLSLRYMGDRQLPDKAIDLLDQAGSIAETKRQHLVGIKDIALILQEMKGIPVTNILKNDNSRLNNLEDKLKQKVKGQEEAIKAVSNAITIAKAGLQDPDKPISSFLFLGTTGVGKTALSLALTESMFDSIDNMIRLDMSEFSERDSLDRFQDLLTTQVKRKPYCILLFDEIEKACTAVHDRLLQVLDAGILRDKRDRSTSFKNTIIIMTTNLGADLITDKQVYETNAVDKVRKQTTNQIARRQDAFRKEVQMELTNIFRPEFINRIEHKVIFNMLTRDIIKEIAVNNLAILNKRMHSHGFKLIYEDDLIEFLADIGTDVKNGARPLARCIENEVSAPVAMYIMQLEGKPGNKIHTFKATVVGEKFGSSLQQHLRGTRKIKFTGIID